MQLLDTDTFNRYYDTAPEEIQAVIDSARIPEFANKIAVELDLASGTIPGITRTIGHVLVGAIGYNEIQTYLESAGGLSAEQSVLAKTRIETFLSHIPSYVQTEAASEVPEVENQNKAPTTVSPTQPLESRERLHLRPTEQVASEAAGWGTAPSVTPITRSHIRESLAPKRTMAGDMAAAKQTSAEASGAPTQIPRYARPMTDTSNEHL